MALIIRLRRKGYMERLMGQQLLSEFSLQKLDCKPLLLRR